MPDTGWFSPPTQEFTVWLRGDLGEMGDEVFTDPEGEASARDRLASWRTNRPDVKSVLLVRTVVRQPWAIAVRSHEAVT